MTEDKRLLLDEILTKDGGQIYEIAKRIWQQDPDLSYESVRTFAYRERDRENAGPGKHFSRRQYNT
ncbi:hypothetical protein KW787_02195 [Candidatus Pacearchaeota archaeon]|nr:hypothetical protein [Candidatus Pacearchaeota archaeon]